MIYFKKIRYKNLLSTGNYFTEIDLCSYPVSVIVGKNGHGKSTILDAVCFGLFGRGFRNVNKGNLINSINGSDLVVEIEFSIGNKEYKIIRGIKPNVFEIYVDSMLLDQVANVRDQQAHLEKNILRLNWKSFTQVVILGSAAHTPFMQLRNHERRDIIEELLDLTVFSTMRTLLKDKLEILKDQLNDINHDISKLETKIELEEEYIQKAETFNTDRTEKVQKDIESTNRELEERRNTVQELNNLIGASSPVDVDKNYKEIDKKIRELEKLESQIQQKIKSFKKQINFFEEHDVCPTCAQTISEELRQTKIERKTSKLREAEGGVDKLQTRVQKLLSNKESLEEQISSIDNTRRKIATHKAHIESLEKYISKIQQDTEEDVDASSILSKRDSVEQNKEKLQKKGEEKETLINRRDVYNVATTLLKDSGIKANVIKQYIPIINANVNKYLQQMDFFVKFTLDENFEESIQSRHLDDFKYFNFSEGEKRRIDLAILFTWRDVAKKKNSMATNLLILDEVFDSALDIEGTDSFVKLVKGLANQNVIIITHNHAITDKLEDDKNCILKFEKAKNFSKLIIT